MESKMGVEYDSIRANLLMHYQNRVWEMVRHVSTIEVGALAGWYFLYDKEHFELSVALLGVACIFIFIFRDAIIRYSHLMSSASASMNHGGDIYLGKYPSGSDRATKIRGSAIAERLPSLALAINISLVPVTLWIWLA